MTDATTQTLHAYQALPALTGDKERDALDCLNTWKLIADCSRTTHMLTQEDIEFITLLIDERIEQLRPQAANAARKNYHTVPEIRGLIMQHLSDMRKEFGSEDFDISVLRFFLKKKTQLRSGDYETSCKTSQITRWDNQVLAAIHPRNWPETPIISASQNRMYKLIAEESP